MILIVAGLDTNTLLMIIKRYDGALLITAENLGRDQKRPFKVVAPSTSVLSVALRHFLFH